MSFYIDLVSNASIRDYPQNTISKFSNRLAQPLEFKEEYEVAITEIYFPLSFTQETRTIDYYIETYDETGTFMQSDSNRFSFKFDHGDSIETVIDNLNDSITFAFNSSTQFEELSYTPPKFELVKNKKNVIEGITYKSGYMENKNLLFFIRFDEEMFWKALGFNYNSLEKMRRQAFASSVKLLSMTSLDVPNFRFRARLMFIYTDIIKPHLVGDSSSNLLRIAPLSEGNYKDMGHIAFHQHNYYPLSQNRIESINILLCDETGQQIKFFDGLVFIQLHFRPKLEN